MAYGLKISRYSKKSAARAGVLALANGKIETPFFMPIATKGTVKTLTIAELKKIGAQIVLGNSYHLYLKPGLEILKKSGDLHKFMDWSGPILTDSGGFQVFSLKTRKAGHNNQPNDFLSGPVVKVTDKGVEFRSVYDGSKHFFTPKSVIQMQQVYGSDITMVLDECIQNPSTHEQAKVASERTIAWAREARKYFSSLKSTRGKLLFGIVQGSLYQDLRLECAHELTKINFSGYAIGGLAVGERPEEMYKVLDYTVPVLPKDKPRYLMGVGYPEQIVEAVKRGVDMFDCVIPTREARHGRLYFFSESHKPKQAVTKKLFASQSYFTLNITNGAFANDFRAINPKSKLAELRKYSRAYLRHLFAVNEPLALRLATLNNLEFYIELMARIRKAVKSNQL